MMPYKDFQTMLRWNRLTSFRPAEIRYLSQVSSSGHSPFSSRAVDHGIRMC
jgi:hypothetical protein